MKKYLLILILLVACSKEDVSTQPQLPTMNGAWNGSGGGIIANLTMVQDGSNVSGSGTLGGVSTYSVLVTGVFSYPNVLFNF